MGRQGALGVVLALVALACGRSPPQPPPAVATEVCDDGLDDDGDGLVDCHDPDCGSAPSCRAADADAGSHGLCPRCGKPCSRQSDCLAESFTHDDPLPSCASSVCESLNVGIDVRFEADSYAWAGVNPPFRSMAVRFIRTLGGDGLPVSCARVREAAPSAQSADADQLERSGRFNLLAFDVSPVSAPPGTVITQPYLSTGTGAGFLIWVELWTGPRDSNTRLPSGQRLGASCFDDGKPVEPLLPEHDWPATGATATSRVIRVTLDGP